MSSRLQFIAWLVGILAALVAVMSVVVALAWVAQLDRHAYEECLKHSTVAECRLGS